ncbi:MAG: protein kinase, partial [Gemmatimonadota bacterium]
LADRYRIERELGQGGMATVYLAQDLKHDRKVAIKVLRPELAAVIGADRFLREIKTIAALQHPHILGLIDSGTARVQSLESKAEDASGQASDSGLSTFVYYVMPFVDGESLRDRLTREKQLPISDAVRIATEVAGALDYAHRRGVIHRDIKPENILLHDGSALVADFGIALAVSSAGGGRMTETGMSLGTPHYMSPEQAMGEREITARSDVYALGAMTYEMLVGDPPFTGSTAQAIVAKVMTEKPAPIRKQRDRVPEGVEDAVLTALEKLPADRFGSAAEFAAALQGQGTATTTARRMAAPPANNRTLRILAVVATLALLAAAALAVKAFRAPAPGPVTRLTLDLPDLRVNHTGYYGTAISLSRDGAHLAFVSRGGGPNGQAGITRLMVRELDELQARALPGTEGADGPFFSPDGLSIAYTANGKLYKVATSGSGQPIQVAEVGLNMILPSGSWLDDGRIIFNTAVYALQAVSSSGGPITTLVPAPRDGGLVYPTALPRKDVLLYTRCSNLCSQQMILAVNFKTGKTDTILAGASRAFYLPQGLLIGVMQDGSVVGAPFDVTTLRFKRTPSVLLTGVQSELGIVPEFTVADDGTMIYLPANATAGRGTPAEVDRSGKGRVLDPAWLGRFTSFSLSPEGRRIAASLADGSGAMLWVKQLDAGPLTRLSFGGTNNYRAAWLPDGRTLSFSSDMTGNGSYLYQVRADGSGQPERLFPTDTSQVDEANWSADGQWVAYRNGTIAGVRSLYARRTSGDTARVVISAGPADEYMPAISPDGHWIAYVSLESGREEVYVRPFPQAERARWQVSSAGGTSPVWSHAGHELFYLVPGDTLVSASVTTVPEFQITGHHALFSTLPFVFQPWHQSFGVRPDDKSFVMLQRTSSIGPDTRRLTVVLNWFTEVNAKVQQAP